MVTVFRQDGLAFRIYPNDHIPSHVHVVKVGCEARIMIADENGEPQILTNEGLSRKDVAKSLALVRENQEILLQQWEEYHG